MAGTLSVTWDIYTRTLLFGRIVGNFAKRSETLTLSVTVLDNGASGTMPTGVIATIKPVNTYGNTSVLVQWTTFVRVGSTNVWTASTTLTSAAITTLLGVVSEFVNCVMDLAGTDGAESDTLAIVLKNNVTRSDDAAPSAAGVSEFYAGQVNGYADGTWATGLITTSFQTSMLYKFVDEDGILRQFIFRASVAATALPGIRRPGDYDSGTNARVFFQVA